jgi:serine/threonine protein kinase
MRIGDVIAGRYQLEEAVGTGGMGEVWRATDLELRRVVALKRATTGDSGETRREARIGAGLHHPNIISVFDVVIEDDRRWLVMEYLPARSLAEICRTDGPITPSLAADIGAQVATALSAMHAKGMVHRDITRANVLVTDNGTAKLADLGVAMWDQVTLTGSAKTAGTPGYVAPEVMAGHRATPASDMYSLGVTLSAAVEGHQQTDEHLAGVLSTLTDQDPNRRPSAEKAAQLLGGSRQRRGSRRVLAATGLGVGVALVITFALILPGSPDSTTNETPRREVPVPPAGEAKLLYGIGEEISSARASEMVRETPVRMFTTYYHKPGDLTRLESSRETQVPGAYADGYALHLVVSDWEIDDPEVDVPTKYGVGCGRAYALSADFLGDMRTLASIFAGKADDPPLYVTVFNEVNNMACKDGVYNDRPSTKAYYDALKDQYLAVRQIFLDEAPNARVALGWQVWQASIDDDPATGMGRSMFEPFANVLRESDFISVLARQPHGNIDQIRRMVRILGKYRPVMLASYGNDDLAGDVVDEDVRELLTDESIAELTELGLFAWSFNDEGVLSKAGRPTLDYVKDVVRRTGREAR